MYLILGNHELSHIPRNAEIMRISWHIAGKITGALVVRFHVVNGYYLVNTQYTVPSRRTVRGNSQVPRQAKK